MKIISVTELALPGVKVIQFGRFRDQRGYFTEPFRRSDFDSCPQLGDLRGRPFVQSNESYSRPNVVRGLHFQWNPLMGKLVRTLCGHMVDIVLDIRKGSPTLGKAVMYEMRSDADADVGEWIWVPPGLAHGNFFPEASWIEYYCTGEYNQSGEAAVSPLASDIDWSACNPALKARFDALVAESPIISDKDLRAADVRTWLAEPRSDHFRYAS